MDNIIAIVQARVGSTRLPGKSLELIDSTTPLLEEVMRRVEKAKTLNGYCVATTFEKEDDRIELLCKSSEWPCIRGPVNDVLYRFTRAAIIMRASIVVRICGDCPIIDPNIIDWCVNTFLHNELKPGIVCTGNSWPDGLDVEVTSVGNLKYADMHAILQSDREHVFPFLRRTNPKVHTLECGNTDLSSHRWCVDTPKDLEFIRAVYPHLKGTAWTDVMQVLKEHPEFIKINAGQTRNSGYLMSLENDK